MTRPSPPEPSPYARYVIDIHKKGDFYSTFAYYTYLNCTTYSLANDAQSSGQCNFPIYPANLESGTYEFTLHSSEDIYSSPLAVSAPISITDSSSSLPGYSMHLLSPNGGEQLTPGQAITVNWRLDYWNQNVQPPVSTKILLQTPEKRIRRGAVYPDTNTLIFQVDTSTTPGANASYTGTIPANTPPGCNYRLVVTLTQLLQLPDGTASYAKDETDGDFCIGQAPPQGSTLTPTSIFTPTPTGVGTTFPTATPTISATKGNISGTIFSSTGGVIAGAKITLRVNNKNTTCTSDAQGKYLIPNLAPGTYSITYVAAGYSQQKSNVTVTAGSTTIFNVTLKRK